MVARPQSQRLLDIEHVDPQRFDLYFTSRTKEITVAKAKYLVARVIANLQGRGTSEWYVW